MTDSRQKTNDPLIFKTLKNAKYNNGIVASAEKKCLNLKWFGEQWHPFDWHPHNHTHSHTHYYTHTIYILIKGTNTEKSAPHKYVLMYVFQWWLLCLHSSTIYFQLQEYDTKTGQFVVNLKNNKTEYCSYVVYKPSIELGRSESENATFCVTLQGEKDKCNLFSSYTK